MEDDPSTMMARRQNNFMLGLQAEIGPCHAQVEKA